MFETTTQLFLEGSYTLLARVVYVKKKHILHHLEDN